MGYLLIPNSELEPLKILFQAEFKSFWFFSVIFSAIYMERLMSWQYFNKNGKILNLKAHLGLQSSSAPY
jgi:hypothetical protein